MNRLYDFGGRRYYQAAPMFTGPDPMAEKYPWLSPYLYCASDPVNLVDPDGREWHITSHRDEDDKLHIRNLRSVAHELGHSGGLDDNDPKILDKNNNLMMQAMYLKPGTYNQATNIEVWQLNKIIGNYNKKNLNLRTPLRNRRYDIIRSKKVLRLK